MRNIVSTVSLGELMESAMQANANADRRLAWRHIEALLAHAQFSTAGEIVDEISEKRHYSLNLSSLTYFTKPLSRCALVTLRQAV